MYKRQDEPINIFNEAINNIKPTVEVRSRRVGGATYQVPVEVKSKRAQALAIRWLVESARKRKDKHMADKIFNELYDAYEKKVLLLKNERMYIKWQSPIRHLLILGGNKLWLELTH